MATYISLIRFTEKGAKEIKKSIDRAAAFDHAAEAAGVKIVGQYWTIGGYDGVLIVSAPSEEKALHWLVALVEGGNVRTETLQAFDATQFAAILGEK
ncbi:MAG: GYD domain-containing protein [Verrucomicrobiales bacterium]|nr:GYD domain-containing protein [Verrucomicrobiales bacterium]